MGDALRMAPYIYSLNFMFPMIAVKHSTCILYGIYKVFADARIYVIEVYSV